MKYYDNFNQTRITKFKITSLSLLVLLLSGCQYETTVKGRVVDENNDPIRNAKITLTGKRGGGELEPETVYSDSEGNFSIDSTAIPYNAEKEAMLLQVQVEGYEDYQQAVPFARDTVGLFIQCKPKR